jgi:hypothetical protein
MPRKPKNVRLSDADIVFAFGCYRNLAASKDDDISADHFDAAWGAFSLENVEQADKLFSKMIRDSEKNAVPEASEAGSAGRGAGRGGRGAAGRGGRGGGRGVVPSKDPTETYKACLSASQLCASKHATLEALALELASNRHYEKALKKTTADLLKKLTAASKATKDIFVKKKMAVEQAHKKLHDTAQLISETMKHMGLLKKL